MFIDLPAGPCRCCHRKWNFGPTRSTKNAHKLENNKQTKKKEKEKERLIDK
jgi:hypothetical protein